MSESSTHDTDDLDELLEEPTNCPDCSAGLARSEDDDAIVLDCPSCDATLVYPKTNDE